MTCFVFQLDQLEYTKSGTAKSSPYSNALIFSSGDVGDHDLPSIFNQEVSLKNESSDLALALSRQRVSLLAFCFA